MTTVILRIAGTVALLVLAVSGFACGNDGSDQGQTPDPGQSRAAARPAWFPATFPLPAETTVVSDQQADGGGTVQFRAPVPLSRAILILDKNLESDSHRYRILSREASENGATYGIENDEYTGTVTLEPVTDATLINVELKARVQ